jgi:hypothetical protein
LLAEEKRMIEELRRQRGVLDEGEEDDDDDVDDIYRVLAGEEESN